MTIDLNSISYLMKKYYCGFETFNECNGSKEKHTWGKVTIAECLHSKHTSKEANKRDIQKAEEKT